MKYKELFLDNSMSKMIKNFFSKILRTFKKEKLMENKEINTQNPFIKSDSANDMTNGGIFSTSYDVRSDFFKKKAPDFLDFLLKHEEKEKQIEEWNKFKSYLFTSDNKISPEMLKEAEIEGFSPILESKHEKAEGSLLLCVSNICLEKSIIKDIIEIYSQVNQKEPKELIKDYVDSKGRNVLHHLTSCIIRKSINNEVIRDEDFEAYLHVLEMDVYLSGDEDENQNTSLDMLSQQTFHLEKYIEKIKKFLNEFDLHNSEEELEREEEKQIE